jgi:hypothetical protein
MRWNSIAMTAIGAALIFHPVLSSAQESNNGSANNDRDKQNTRPIKPGGVRVFTRAPEPGKWNAQTLNNGAKRIFRCKPLGCSSPQSIIFTFSKSPTRKPDPTALEKYAKVDFPKSLRAAIAALEVMTDKNVKIETLVAKTGTLKGYPAVINQSRLRGGKTTNYIDTTILFAGPLMIRIESVSPNHDLAQQSLREFIEVMVITEGPPMQPPSPPTPAPAVKPATPGTQSL